MRKTRRLGTEYCSSASASNVQTYAADLASKVRLTHDIIQKNMTDRAVRSKEFYDKNTEVPQIVVGSKVLLFNDALKPGESPKFHDNWTGPYLVVSKSDNGLLYRLRHLSLIHISEPTRPY